MINIALFGYGRAGKIHYNNSINNSNINLKYLVELNDVSNIIDKNVKYVNYENINVIFEDEKLDAVIITTPTKTHYEIIINCLNHNKHVFIEKPITEDKEEITKCFELAKNKNLVLFVGYNRRYDNTIQNIKNKISNNEIGKINYALTISRDYPYPQDSFLKISGGIFHDCATHDIDYMNWVLNDKPISVYVSVPDNDNTQDFSYDHVTINFKYSTGTIVCMNLSRISSSYDQRCEFYGISGEIINNEFKQNCKLSFPDRYKQAFETELASFLNCINNNELPLVTKEDCINNYIIANACQESVIQNKRITIKYGDGFRNYENISKNVYENYLLARTYQNVKFVNNMHKKYSTLNIKMEIWDILEKLNGLVDVSDPDVSHPNLYHAMQTAEMMRKDKLPDWMQLIGLIHDIGKIMYLKGDDVDGTGTKKQWAMVGDTFIVGCKLSDKLIFPEFNKYNLDMNNKIYNNKYGIYDPGCGLDNVLCSWGHDEYLYKILSSPKNPNTIPEEGLYMARFHSLYAYHDKEDYFYFQSEKDKKMLSWLKKFNKYDLYSKCDTIIDINETKEYYNDLIKKYFTNSYLYI